jgi:hypothetical protein
LVALASLPANTPLPVIASTSCPPPAKSAVPSYRAVPPIATVSAPLPKLADPA